MALLDRFLKYVKIDTMSDDKNDSVTPSTEKQFNLAYELEKELNELGLKNVHINKYCTVYAKLEANAKGYDSIGFLAHMDTIPEVSGTNVKPNVVKYDGSPILLGNTGLTLNDTDFPWMKKQLGHTLVTTDGTTVLGCDDKGGIAVIMTMLEEIIKGKFEHGDIYIAFTPDEEIGTGVLKFDVNEFPVKYAYTVDGGDYTEFSYETFNAASAHCEFKGFEIHPGAAKGKMINASRLAIKFDELLPEFARPEYTEQYEGFNHLHHLEGETGHATSDYIIRNHSSKLLEEQKNQFRAAEQYLNSLYKDCCKVTITDSYKNMREIIEKDMTCVEKALKAYEKAGIKVHCAPTRGGTDGSRITFMGIPTPNLGTGGYNEHGVHEYADMYEMENMVKVALNIATTK